MQVRTLSRRQNLKGIPNSIIYGYTNNRIKNKVIKIALENGLEEINLGVNYINKRIKYEKIKKECPACGIEFICRKGHKNEKATCSYSCSNTHFRSGSDHPNWKEDTYRSTCFDKHKKECIICGEDKIVEVHHFDEDHSNNEVNNLIPLCPTHHRYYHSRYKCDIENKIIEYRNKFINI